MLDRDNGAAGDAPEVIGTSAGDRIAAYVAAVGK